MISSCGGFEDDGVAIYCERDGVFVRGVHGSRSVVVAQAVGLGGVWDGCTGCGRGWEDSFYWDFLTELSSEPLHLAAPVRSFRGWGGRLIKKGRVRGSRHDASTP